MIVVIQCAASKRMDAGQLRTQDGKSILFVANPELAPDVGTIAYARPDDESGDGQSWRQMLLRYNETPTNNPLGLSKAYELYTNDAYRRLVHRFGSDKTFILSAGWGIISASFLTPAYDITFSAAAESYKRRRKNERYYDFCMLPARSEEKIVFLGGKDYLPLFCFLSSDLQCERTVFYNSSSPPIAPGCSMKRFVTTTRTNWHYECASRLLDGTLKSD